MPSIMMYVTDLQSLALDARMCFAIVATLGNPLVVIVFAQPVNELVMIVFMLFFLLVISY